MQPYEMRLSAAEGDASRRQAALAGHGGAHTVHRQRGLVVDPDDRLAVEIAPRRGDEAARGRRALEGAHRGIGRWPMPGTLSSPRAEPSSTGAVPPSRPAASNTYNVASFLSTIMNGRPCASPPPAAQSASRRASADTRCAPNSARARIAGDRRRDGRRHRGRADALSAGPCANGQRQCAGDDEQAGQARSSGIGHKMARVANGMPMPATPQARALPTGKGAMQAPVDCAPTHCQELNHEHVQTCNAGFAGRCLCRVGGLREASCGYTNAVHEHDQTPAPMPPASAASQ